MAEIECEGIILLEIGAWEKTVDDRIFELEACEVDIRGI